tara:strand:- start:1405 stop:1842 length:438 start_codon:yes stop_codon:yes gene_type:complete
MTEKKQTRNFAYKKLIDGLVNICGGESTGQYALAIRRMLWSMLICSGGHFPNGFSKLQKKEAKEGWFNAVVTHSRGIGGLGTRQVAKLMNPSNFDIDRVFEIEDKELVSLLYDLSGVKTSDSEILKTALSKMRADANASNMLEID